MKTINTTIQPNKIGWNTSYKYKVNLINPILHSNGNWSDLLQLVKDTKQQLKSLGINRFRLRGRGKKKHTFNLTNRYYYKSMSSQNDVSINSAEGKYMNYYTLYGY